MGDEYQRAAELGLHTANCHLGELYIQGKGVEQDAARGVALCEKAAAKDSVPAMLKLGRLHLMHAELRNEQTALNWYASAASYQSAEAQYQLGVMLRDGIGIAQDAVVSQQWFEAAAGQGYQPAYFENARLLYAAPKNPATGLWHEEDLAKAYLWLSASLRTSDDDEIKAQSRDMLNQVLKVMPQSWVGDLDSKVDAHLKQFNSETATTPAS